MICKLLKNLFRFSAYSSLLLFAAATLFVAYEPEYIGVRYQIIKQSFKNTFYPTEFEKFKKFLRYYSHVRISRWNDHKIVGIIEEAFAFEYEYWCKYIYIDKNGNQGINIDHVIHNWKPWEYYYLEFDKNYITPEHKRAMILRKEWMLKYRDSEIEKHRRYEIY